MTIPGRATRHRWRRLAWPARLVRALAAAALLAALVGGIPWALHTVAGTPIPERLPTLEQIRDALFRPDDGSLFLTALKYVGWAGWAIFVFIVALEVAGQLGGWQPPALPALGAPQELAGVLVAAVAAAVIANPAAGDDTPAAARPVVTAAAPPTPGAAPPPQTEPPTGPDPGPRPHTAARAAPDQQARTGKTYVVRRGDTLWRIAERTLGDGARYQEIAELNYGRPQPDGQTLTDAHWIRPGWRLYLPVDARAVRPPAERGSDRAHVVVAEGDTLWDLAETHLGHGSEWPAIWNLNAGHAQPDGHALTDPDLLRPGWILRLPTPEHERGQQPSRPPTAPEARPTPPEPPPAPPTAEPTASPTAPGTPTASASEPGDDLADHDAPDDERGEGDGGGAEVPGGWITWPVAGAVLAAMAVVLLQRRRRYIPRPLDEPADPGPVTAGPPPVVRAIQQAWQLARRATPHQVPPASPDGNGAGNSRRPPMPAHPSLAIPDVPPIQPPPAGGLGLTGPGAEAAARGLLVAALTAGAPDDPGAHAGVVIPAATLVTLLGADAVDLRGWSRLTVTADLDTALGVLEARLLHAARLLDEHEVGDVTALRQTAPYEEPLPPLLLITEPPPHDAQARLRTVLGLGGGVGVTAVILGAWKHGATRAVDPDGATRQADPGGRGAESGDKSQDEPAERMSVLDATSAYDLLRTLREAHTGQPDLATLAPREDTSGSAADQPEADAETEEERPSAPDSGAPAPAPSSRDTDEPAIPKAAIHVLGEPRVEHPPAGLKVRSAAIELMVYLAVHADGAHPDQIMEDLLPEIRPRLASTRVHTAVSNLRQLLARAAGGSDPRQYVLKERGRYRLNPNAVDVDLWRLREGCARARATRDPQARLAALRHACQTYQGELAESQGYDWITAQRQGARVLAVDAHTAAAAALADTDPHQAARLLHAATRHDTINEHVAQQAMRAHGRIGDAEAITALLRHLARALDTIGAEPTDDTLDLAEKLRRDLNPK